MTRCILKLWPFEMDRVLAATLKKLTRPVRARLKGLIEGRLGVEVFLQAMGWPFEIHASATMGVGACVAYDVKDDSSRRQASFLTSGGRTHDQRLSIWKDLKTFSLIQDSTLQMSLRFLLGSTPSLETRRMVQIFFPTIDSFFFFHPSCVQRMRRQSL